MFASPAGELWRYTAQMTYRRGKLLSPSNPNATFVDYHLTFSEWPDSDGRISPH